MAVLSIILTTLIAASSAIASPIAPASVAPSSSAPVATATSTSLPLTEEGRLPTPFCQGKSFTLPDPFLYGTPYVPQDAPYAAKLFATGIKRSLSEYESLLDDQAPQEEKEKALEKLKVTIGVWTDAYTDVMQKFCSGSSSGSS